MAIELRVVQFWSKIILVISNLEITRMISDQIALHSGQLPLILFKVLMVIDLSGVQLKSLHGLSLSGHYIRTLVFRCKPC